MLTINKRLQENFLDVSWQYTEHEQLKAYLLLINVNPWETYLEYIHIKSLGEVPDFFTYTFTPKQGLYYTWAWGAVHEQDIYDYNMLFYGDKS